MNSDAGEPLAPGLDDLTTLRAVWEAAVDALALSDADGRVLAVNRAYCCMYGFRSDELVGRTFALIFPEEIRDTAERSYREVFQRGEATVAESAVLTGDGRELIVEARASFIEREGRRVAMLSSIRDVTRQRRAEAERDLLIAAASHDLLQPLTLIKGRAQLVLRGLRSGKPSTTDLERTFRAIVATVDEASAQLASLVDSARLRAGQSVLLNRGASDVTRLVRDLVAEHQASTEGCQIRCHVPEQPLIGHFDEPRLRRVIGNLLSNAIKYSPERGDIVVRLAAEPRETGLLAVLEVEDHGVGIPQADLPNVFQDYRRGANVIATTQGSGLGLAGAMQIVRQHGGTIEVESREGHGSLFRLYLPLGLD